MDISSLLTLLTLLPSVFINFNFILEQRKLRPKTSNARENSRQILQRLAGEDARDTITPMWSMRKNKHRNSINRWRIRDTRRLSTIWPLLYRLNYYVFLSVCRLMSKMPYIYKSTWSKLNMNEPRLGQRSFYGRLVQNLHVFVFLLLLFLVRYLFSLPLKVRSSLDLFMQVPLLKLLKLWILFFSDIVKSPLRC